MRAIETSIGAELEVLQGKYTKDEAKFILELTQKEIHHREKIRAMNRIRDGLGGLEETVFSK